MNHNTKKCTKCQEIFPANLEFFYKKQSNKYCLSSWCKSCMLDQKKEYYINNKEKIKNKNKDRYYKNRNKILNQKKQYQIKPDAIRKRRITKNKYYNNKLKFNVEYKIRQNLSNRLRDYINKSGSSIVLFLGCSIDNFKIHIEKLFTEGMTWDNYGKYGWHIDHIRPCCSFDMSDPKQVMECFHYSNLQPLWAIDNLKKNGKY